MSAEVSTEIRIPDVWYDFYARLVPGSVVVAAFYVLMCEKTIQPDGWEIVLILASGYVLSLFSQPISSRLTGGLHRLSESIYGKNRTYVREIQRKLGTTSRQSMILSKMHGEVTFFVQMFVLSLALLAIDKFGSVHWPAPLPALCWFIVAFLVAAFEVALRRLKRAIDVEMTMSAVKHDALPFESM